jgi:DNA-binding NarL/FixJ family response regulator
MARFDWPESRDLLAAALDAEESPEVLESLAVATFWTREVGRAVDLRQRAYRLYLDRGDRRCAARMAISLALDYEHHLGQTAVASGWKERASHLLESIEPCAEHAWLLLWRAHHAILFHQDVERGRGILAEAVEMARRLGLQPVEVMARGLRGFTLVAEGKLDEGMRCLDETATAALAGEIADPEARGSACCYVLSACEHVLDLDRAGQWQRRVLDVYEQRDDQLGLTFCRKHCINLLIWSGEWERAEAEIERMRLDVPRDMRLLATDVRMALGELRVRQGRRAEARAIFDEEPTHPRAVLGRAALELAEDRPQAALRTAERYLRQLGDSLRTDFVPGLLLVVRAASASGEIDRAAEAAATLDELAAGVTTDLMKALAASAKGIVAAARSDVESARANLEHAIALFAAASASYDGAQARLDLASVLRALGEDDAAVLEAKAALAIFTRLGAADGAARARRESERSASPTDDEGGALAALSDRELEVLRLVAQGLSNSAIAVRLHLSAHTVKRHVANILGKLDLPTRAAAAALAVRSGLN